MLNIFYNGYVMAFLLAGPTIPCSLALHRKMTDRTALCLIALLTSWTGIGWFACILWAALGPVERPALDAGLPAVEHV